MIYSSKTNINDRIVEILAAGDSTVADLHNLLVSEGRNISLQAVYNAIRSLTEATVILKQKGVCSLSAEWQNHVLSLLSNVPDLPQLAVGESVRYVFTSYSQLDAYWKHINAVFANNDSNQPIFFYDPHEIWIYLEERRKSQVTFLEGLAKAKRSAYMLIGGVSLFDSLYKNKFGRYLCIELDDNVPLKRNEHLTVCGDYIIVTKLPSEVGRLMDSAYQESKTEVDLQNALRKVFITKQRLTVTMYNNPERARSLCKRITKDMYIPKTERETYNLF